MSKSGQSMSEFDPHVTRRRMLAMGVVAGLAAVLPGCAGGSRRTRTASSARLAWPGIDEPAPAPAQTPDYSAALPTTPRPTPTPGAVAPNVLPRSAWARQGSIPGRMDRLDRIERITVHHDGMPPVFVSNRQEVAARIDQIRGVHQSNGWGDIGYHFIVDPTGQVWEGRPLIYQGAHVKNQNERNLGILVLGNFEMQSPTPAQIAATERFLAQCMRTYRVPLSRVATHRELAPTLCPGRNLQMVMNRLRSSNSALTHA